MLQHHLAERGELDREGDSASEAHTKALEGDGEHVFVKLWAPSDGSARILQYPLQEGDGALSFHDPCANGGPARQTS